MCTSNQFIVGQYGDVGDFILRLIFRASGNGGKWGVQCRSVLRPHGLDIGCKADIVQSGGFLGLQLRVGKPMIIQFKDVCLKKF